MGTSSTNKKNVIRVIVVSLLIDLLAFTIPLPLFPRIIEAYIDRELPNAISKQNGYHFSHSLLASIIGTLSNLRARLSASASASSTGNALSSPKTDIVLLGGLLGSIFALCQFVVSPYIGSLADKHGRRRVLLLTMFGNIISALLWLFASNFELYLLSRIVSGLSEGNAQLAIAIISDVTSPEERPRKLALVGMCFALAFTFGPPLGAYLVKELPLWTSQSLEGKSNLLSWLFPSTASHFVLPALVTVVLLVIETLYLYLYLPETRHWKQKEKDEQGERREQVTKTEPIKSSPARSSIHQRRKRIRSLKFLFFIFSFVFSGTEFTLTFLTFDLLSYSNSQNGRLLGAIGLLSSLIQGGIVRRRASKVGPSGMVKTGLYACAGSLFLLAYLPRSLSGQNKSSATSAVLMALVLTMAWTSATVVNSLNAMASNECDEDDASARKQGKSQDDALPKGRTMGNFRSAGQLGRAMGPLTITAAYWLYGPSLTYTGLGCIVVATKALSQSILRQRGTKAKTL